MITGFSADSRLLVLRGSKAHHQVWNLADDAMRGIPLDSSTFRGLDTYADVRGVEPYAVFGKTNGTVEFWNLGTMSRVKSWRVSETGVAVAALSPDVRFIATTDEERKMKLWELATARQVRGFSPLKGKMHFLTFSPNGRLLAGLARGSRYVYIWDVDTGRLLRELDTRSEWVGTLAFSPDSKLLANACQNNTQLWEIPSGKLRATLKGHIDAVTGVAFSPDGKTLATSGDDRRVKLWNLATKQEVATSELLIGGCRALQFSPDGRTLAVGQSLEMELYIWLWQVPSFEEIAAAEAKEKAEINQP
jgi:WD40 repeat protein